MNNNSVGIDGKSPLQEIYKLALPDPLHFFVMDALLHERTSNLPEAPKQQRITKGFHFHEY